MTHFPIMEHEHTINGVSGRMFTVHAPQEVRGNMVLRNQKWISEGRKITGYGTDGVMHVTLRFDDECANGHQTFSITADVYTRESRRQKDIAAGGCLHDEIKKIFPELTPLTKWHLVSTDGPMHYISNTLYMAGDRDCNGHRRGEPLSWHDCPFDDEKTAQEWVAGLNSADYRLDRIPTEFSEGKKRELDHARNAACWEDATDEELSADREVLKAALEARLPTLIAEFRATMESIGFIWM